jgi:hypothetical protein
VTHLILCTNNIVNTEGSDINMLEGTCNTFSQKKLLKEHVLAETLLTHNRK